MSQERNWEQIYYQEDLNLAGVRLRNTLVRECRISSIAKAWLIDCDLQGSFLDCDDIRDVLDATATMNCFTFSGVQLSETALDSLIYLLTTTIGNDEKRDALRALLSGRRLELFQRVFPMIGR